MFLDQSIFNVSLDVVRFYLVGDVFNHDFLVLEQKANFQRLSLSLRVLASPVNDFRKLLTFVSALRTKQNYERVFCFTVQTIHEVIGLKAGIEFEHLEVQLVLHVLGLC